MSARWLGCLTLLAVRCAAADSSTAAASSVATARQEIEALKVETNATRAGVSTRDGIPVIALPQMETTPGAMIAAPKPVVQDPLLERKENAGSWLVDAVERARKEDRRRAVDGPLGVGEKRTDSKDEEEKPEGADRPGGRDRQRPADRPVVVNPLSKYMTDWLAPQDHAVLQRTLETAAPGSGDVRLGVESGDVGVVNAAGYGPADVAKERAAQAIQKPAENPFIAAFTLPPAALSTPSVPPRASDSPRNSTQPLQPPPPPAESKSPVPDFAKPGDDKYFKPLKRF